jgi:hypothetical protein
MHLPRKESDSQTVSLSAEDMVIADISSYGLGM